MYRKNVAGQFIGFVGVNATTGAAMTGTTGFAAYRVVDGAAQASATGTVTDKGNGQYSFALSQADTNGDDVSILFTMTGMIPVEKTFVTAAAVIDVLLSRDVSNVEATAPEHSLAAVILATTEWAIAGTAWTIYRSDGSTTFASKTITVTSGQVTGVA